MFRIVVTSYTTLQTDGPHRAAYAEAGCEVGARPLHPLVNRGRAARIRHRLRRRHLHHGPVHGARVRGGAAAQDRLALWRRATTRLT